MFKKDHRVPVQLPGLSDSLYFLEFRFLLITQVSLCSWSFLISHTVAFSFLSSGTLKTALPANQTIYSLRTNRCLMIKFRLFPKWEWRHRGFVFYFTQKIPLSMMTRMEDSYKWLSWEAIEWLEWNEPWFKNWLMTVFPVNDGFTDKNCTI